MRRPILSVIPIILFACLLAMPVLALAGDLIEDGNFSAAKNGADLRKNAKGPDWYESRKDTDEGRELLKVSKKKIHGNKTAKAMIKAHPEFNTYLTQKLLEPQAVSVVVQYDILVREILPDDNRSAFFFLGAIKDKKGGPCSTGRERFVFLGFENSTEPGKINLFAREEGTKWDEKTLVAENLDLNSWYTISVDANIPEAFYTVTVEGVVEQFELLAFSHKGRTLEEVTHISFASWNDGAGTFYVDNVMANGN
jgi:hypothetical protein